MPSGAFSARPSTTPSPTTSSAWPPGRSTRATSAMKRACSARHGVARDVADLLRARAELHAAELLLATAPATGTARRGGRRSRRSRRTGATTAPAPRCPPRIGSARASPSEISGAAVPGGRAPLQRRQPARQLRRPIGEHARRDAARDALLRAVARRLGPAFMNFTSSDDRHRRSARPTSSSGSAITSSRRPSSSNSTWG